MIFNDQIKQFISNEIGRMNASLNHSYRIEKFCLLADNWSVKTREYTAEYELNRQKIIENYQKEIEAFYQTA